MNHESEIDYICPHCNSEIQIVIEIESPSDYYADTTCPECSSEISCNDLGDKISEEATQYFVRKYFVRKADFMGDD